jgi:hypothetical protein
MSLYFTPPADYADRYRARMAERGEPYRTPPMGSSDGERCDWCGVECDDPCIDECDCPSCETERALDDDADMSREMIEP